MGTIVVLFTNSDLLDIYKGFKEYLRFCLFQKFVFGKKISDDLLGNFSPSVCTNSKQLLYLQSNIFILRMISDHRRFSNFLIINILVSLKTIDSSGVTRKKTKKSPENLIFGRHVIRTYTIFQYYKQIPDRRFWPCANGKNVNAQPL